MLEKINDPKYSLISKASETVIEYLNYILNKNSTPIYYEIGVGIGATTLKVAQKLENNGQIYIFSRKVDCLELKKDLFELGYTNINDFGSETNTYSGYHFDMALALLNKKLIPFDLCFLDGGHVFHLDAPTTCIIKELCKVNGYIIFDDYTWSLKKSPSLNPLICPKTKKDYDDKQIEYCHIKMICDLFMETDARYKNVLSSSKRYKIYKRKF